MKIFITLSLILSLTSLRGESLYEVYQNAGPGNGYDKYMVLNPNVIYTGGFGTSVYSVLLEGNGAVIDLQGGTGIWMSGDESSSPPLVIKRCTIMNGGYYGVNFPDTEITKLLIVTLSTMCGEYKLESTPLPQSETAT